MEAIELVAQAFRLLQGEECAEDELFAKGQRTLAASLMVGMVSNCIALEKVVSTEESLGDIKLSLTASCTNPLGDTEFMTLHDSGTNSERHTQTNTRPTNEGSDAQYTTEFRICEEVAQRRTSGIAEEGRNHLVPTLPTEMNERRQETLPEAGTLERRVQRGSNPREAERRSEIGNGTVLLPPSILTTEISIHGKAKIVWRVPLKIALACTQALLEGGGFSRHSGNGTLNSGYRSIRNTDTQNVMGRVLYIRRLMHRVEKVRLGMKRKRQEFEADNRTPIYADLLPSQLRVASKEVVIEIPMILDVTDCQRKIRRTGMSKLMAGIDVKTVELTSELVQRPRRVGKEYNFALLCATMAGGGLERVICGKVLKNYAEEGIGEEGCSRYRTCPARKGGGICDGYQSGRSGIGTGSLLKSYGDARLLKSLDLDTAVALISHPEMGAFTPSSHSPLSGDPRIFNFSTEQAGFGDSVFAFVPFESLKLTKRWMSGAHLPGTHVFIESSNCVTQFIRPGYDDMFHDARSGVGAIQNGTNNEHADHRQSSGIEAHEGNETRLTSAKDGQGNISWPMKHLLIFPGFRVFDLRVATVRNAYLEVRSAALCFEDIDAANELGQSLPTGFTVVTIVRVLSEEAAKSLYPYALHYVSDRTLLKCHFFETLGDTELNRALDRIGVCAEDVLRSETLPAADYAVVPRKISDTVKHFKLIWASEHLHTAPRKYQNM